MTKAATQLSVVVLASVLAVAPVSAQRGHPNFSGRWFLETPASESGGANPVEVIRHEGNQLATGHAGDSHSVVYVLDGTEHRTTSFGADVVSSAVWQGDKVVIVRTVSRQGGSLRRTRQVWSLDAAGKLTIEWINLDNEQEKPLRRVYSKK